MVTEVSMPDAAVEQPGHPLANEEPGPCEMSRTDELATKLNTLETKVGRIEERLDNHIKFFWAAVSIGFLWLGGISGTLFSMNGKLEALAQAQANAAPKTVAAILGHPVSSRPEAIAGLNLASAVLQRTPVGKTKPDVAVVQNAADKLVQIQGSYPELPEVWTATSAFINYKYATLASGYSKVLQAAKGHPCKPPESGKASIRFCEVDLETFEINPQGVERSGTHLPYVFEDCIVHYRGGPLGGKNAMFWNCVFQVQIPGVPSPSGILAIQELTMANPNGPVRIKT